MKNLKNMKTPKLLLALVILFSGNIMFAQKVEVNTKKSSVEWVGEKIGGQHEGNIQIKSGYLELENDKIVLGNFVIDMTTITNTDLEDEGYNQKLVGHLKSDDFFGVEKYPTSNFIFTKSSKFKDGKATVKGDITIKGKTESISFEVTRAGEKYSAKIDIDRSKFDVRYGSDSFFDNLGDKAIDDIFTLTVKLVTK
jgi:polyisoprenoid-binding protein YceI